MKDKWQSLYKKLKTPSVLFRIFVYIFTVIIIGVTLFTLFIKDEGKWVQILSYLLYGLSAISLAYSVYLVVKNISDVKHKTITFLKSKKFTRTILENFGFRTLVFSVGSFITSVAFASFNAYMGIQYLSIWYGALAMYYLMLAFTRGGVLFYHGKKRISDKTVSENQEKIRQAKTYRNSGTVLLILNVALSSAIAQMIFDQRYFEYAGWTIYGFSAYAFYKIIMSVINVFRAKKQNDLTVKAIRNINLTDATVSILALQTALLNTFSTEGVNVGLFNTLTGSVVSVFNVALGIFIIVKANKIIKNLYSENIKNERQ